MSDAPTRRPSVGRQHSTLISSRRAELRPLPLLIKILQVAVHPNPARLSEGSCVLGAGSEADVVIEAASVSRRHAELSLVPEGVRVTDLGSKNGLFYLGQRFESMVLSPGSRFRLGTVEVELALDTDTLAQEQMGSPDRYGDLIGASAALRQLFSQLVRLEGSKVNLLITGESGTGKELVARAIHEHSPVRLGPLVAVNCGALDRALVRSELFGHERGAFTGASERRVGAFAAADGGTLFLDEIGELPLDVQPVLLRALELRCITSVGSHRELPVDVRVIAATHRDLQVEVQNARFREDLFYRISVVPLHVPPLRERPEDVALIANSLARRHGVGALPEDFVQALRQHHWPGNVRELCNAVEAYLALGAVRTGSGGAGTALDATLRSFVDPNQTYAEQKAEILQRFTRAYLERLLEATGGNQSEAARTSGLQRSYLGKLIAKLGLRQG